MASVEKQTVMETIAQAAPPRLPDSNAALCRRFLELEEELDLFDRIMDGVHFWEYLRFYVFLELQRALGLAHVESFQAGSTWSRWLKRFASSISGLFAHNPFLTTQKQLCFFGCPRRVPGDDGQWWDTAVDPYIQALGCPYFYIERYSGDRHCRPTRTRQVKYFDLLSMISCGYRTLCPAVAIGAEGDWLRELGFELHKRFDVHVNLQCMAANIWKTRRCLVWIFERLLGKVQPRAVFFASINYPERAALEVCKNLGIPTIELQHGVIGPFDLSYVFPENVKLNYFPDQLFVWGRYWQNSVRFPLPPDSVRPIGYPFLEMQLRKYDSLPAQDQVVVVSQPTVGEELSRFAVELSRRSDFPSRVIYRLHPYETDWRQRYPWLGPSKVEVSTSDDGSLYALFAQSRMQIGAYSAALFEGLAFGLPTWLVNVPGVEYLQPLIDRGFCRLVNEASEITCDAARSSQIDRELFFQSDGIRRFKDAVREITGLDV